MNVSHFETLIVSSTEMRVTFCIDFDKQLDMLNKFDVKKTYLTWLVLHFEIQFMF